MFLLFGGVVMLVVTNVLCQEVYNGAGVVVHTEPPHHQPPEHQQPQHQSERSYQIPNTFVDVFKPGMSGRPTLG